MTDSGIDWLRDTDIYLIDQILKGRFPAGTEILEAGCGGGRNLTWFLRSGYKVYAVDNSLASIGELRALASSVAPQLPFENLRTEPVEQLSFPDNAFDAVLSIAVLHFARDESHFKRMLREMWRVLKPGGMLFARLGSTVGIEHLVKPLGEPRRYAVPDGSVRFLVDVEMLMRLTDKLGAKLLEPIKTVNVQNLRCMTTWVIRKLGEESASISGALE